MEKDKKRVAKRAYAKPSIISMGKYRKKTKSLWGKRNETYFSNHYGGWFE